MSGSRLEVPTRWTFDAGAEVARARAYGRCEVCAMRPDTQSHHRQPRGMGGVSGVGLVVNSPANLVRICQVCHDRAESYRDRARRVGLLVPRPTDPATVPVRLRTVNGTGWYLLLESGDYHWQDLPEDWSACA